MQTGQLGNKEKEEKKEVLVLPFFLEFLLFPYDALHLCPMYTNTFLNVDFTGLISGSLSLKHTFNRWLLLVASRMSPKPGF